MLESQSLKDMPTADFLVAYFFLFIFGLMGTFMAYALYSHATLNIVTIAFLLALNTPLCIVLYSFVKDVVFRRKES